MKNVKEEVSDFQYRDDFPIFKNSKMAYLDSAATAQRPECVINAVKEFYENSNANPLRGLYELSLKATECYENSRKIIQDFIHADKMEEIIFTRNTTEGINLVAYSYGLENLKKDDEIVVTIMEHHSNLLPWQMVARKTGAKLKFLECSKDGIFADEDIEKIFTSKTKIAAVTYVSNVYGRVNPVEKIIKKAHEKGAVVLVDAAQAVMHMPIDVVKMDVDFLAFSGHKMMAPMGIGVLYGKKSLLEEMTPFLSGGEMIDSVSRTDAVFAELPAKFEAGTVNAGGAVGMAAAATYLEEVGFDEIKRIEDKLTKLALDKMRDIPGVNIIGSKEADEHCGIITFTVDGVHPHDVASILDSDNVGIRAGHHCAQPLMDYLEVGSTVRASIGFYNNNEDIERFIESLKNVRRRMGYEQ